MLKLPLPPLLLMPARSRRGMNDAIITSSTYPRESSLKTRRCCISDDWRYLYPTTMGDAVAFTPGTSNTSQSFQRGDKASLEPMILYNVPATCLPRGPSILLATKLSSQTPYDAITLPCMLLKPSLIYTLALDRYLILIADHHYNPKLPPPPPTCPATPFCTWPRYCRLTVFHACMYFSMQF